MNKDKIKFLVESGLLSSALYEAQKFDKKCEWLFECKPDESHPEYQNWKIAMEKELKRVLGQ